MSVEDARLLINQIEDYAIVILDTGGYVATWNLGAEKIDGYTADEIVGQHVSTFYSPEDIAAGKPERDLLIAREVGRVDDEAWRIRKDGSRFWASVVITALRNNDGSLRGYGNVTRDLTLRKKAEEELRLAEERFHILVDGITDYAVFMLDPDGFVLTWNNGAKRIKGYRAQEIIGQHFSRFYLEADVRSGKCEHNLRLAREQNGFEEEGWRIRKDGSQFWASAVIKPLYNGQESLIGYAKVTRDLTQRHEAEEVARKLVREQAARAASERAAAQIRESDERYRSLSKRLEVILEGVADGITVQEPSGRVLFANTAAARACGLSSVQELLNVTPDYFANRFEILDADGAPFDLGNLPGRRVLRGEQPGAVIMHVRDRSSGKAWWSSVRASGVGDVGGKPELAINIWHDVTVQYREELHAKHLARAIATLTSSLDYESMLASLANVLVPDLADWCSVSLLEGEQLKSVAVAHVNPDKVAMAREIQRRYPPDPAHPGGAWSVIRSGVSALYEEVPDELLQRGARDADHLQIIRSIGMKSVIIAPIRIRDRVIGTLTAISAESGRRYDKHDVPLLEELGRRAGIAIENAMLYEAAQQAARQAEEASRFKDEFLATVSHELRTPLNAIVGWSSLLRNQSSDPTITKAIEVIHRNAEAQVKIIDDILDVSRIIARKLRLELKPTDLTKVVRDAIEAIRPTLAQKNLSLQFVPPTTPSLMVADPERLQQVIWNLLSNAAKFTKAGGAISISIGRQGPCFEVSVTDTGCGIDPAFLPFVFDRFKQADGSTTRRVGGLGLGLALVKHIVELHRGQVRAASEGTGKGATFTLTLPVPAMELDTREEVESQKFTASLDGVRVLIVDDEEDAREVLQTAIANAGGVVEAARSAKEAFARVTGFRPHVLVSDIGMPEEDGYSLMKRIRALERDQGGNVPSIALTAYTRSEERSQALAVGFTTHICKPVNPADLLTLIGNLAVPAE
ncbi:MAG TPA: PAS domain S-box protein [Polyangiaceae bacterium]|nr:PAS domain S-box protein [Polyangiaceae bacterium]